MVVKNVVGNQLVFGLKRLQLLVLVSRPRRTLDDEDVLPLKGSYNYDLGKSAYKVFNRLGK